MATAAAWKAMCGMEAAASKLKHFTQQCCAISAAIRDQWHSVAPGGGGDAVTAVKWLHSSELGIALVTAVADTSLRLYYSLFIVHHVPHGTRD
jgi:hypothetical protein